jgi:hypothetical protein
MQTFYQHPVQIWDKKTCEKYAKRIATDGMGTKYPFAGYIGKIPGYGKTIYNGGCIRENKWYNGENYPLPKLAAGFEIVTVSSWGLRIVKK